MFFYGFWGYAEAVVSPSDGVELFLRGRQWQWEVTYPNGATTGLMMSKSRDAPGFEPFAQSRNPRADAKRLGKDDRPVIVVPAGVPVKFRMISEDVLHAFWVPDFRTKLDVIPNRYTNVWFQADEDQIGDHWVFCAEYCGNDHSEMLAVLRVLPWEQYQQVIGEWGQPENPVDWGRLLWTNKCSTCHSIDGKFGTGPTWHELWGKTEKFSNSTETRVVDETYVRESIITPGYLITEGFKNQMTPFTSLSEEQINAIIQFMKSPEVAGKNAPAPAPTEGGAESKPAEGAGGAAGGAAKK
jgi:cytochrome c oxidase subunit 2